MFSAIRLSCEMTTQHEARWWHIGITIEQCTQLLNNLQKISMSQHYLANPATAD